MQAGPYDAAKHIRKMEKEIAKRVALAGALAQGTTAVLDDSALPELPQK